MSDDPSQPQAAPSGDGEVSQADIDALMAGGSSPSEAPAATEDASETGSGDGGAFSQADIDALMSGGGESGDSAAAEAPPADTSGAVSQDDIDALISGADAGAESAEDTPAAEAEAPATDDRVDSMGRPFDEMAAMMQAAIEEEKAEAANAPPPPSAPIPPPPSGSAPPNLPSFDAAIAGIDPNRVTMLNDVKLRVKIELGRTRMLVEDVLKLGEGAVVELDKLAGDPVDVYVNDRLVARGEVLVLNDNFCVRISDVISNDPHRVTA